MDYDFSRYVSYMQKHKLDLVIASNFELTARMLTLWYALYAAVWFYLYWRFW